MHHFFAILAFAVAVTFTACQSPSRQETIAQHSPKPPPDPKMGCFTDEDFKRVGLPSSAADRIIDSRSFWICITHVRNVREARRPEGDLLGVSLSIAKSAGWEGVYHTTLVLRKEVDEPDWSKAQIYILSSSRVFSTHDLFALPWNRIWRHVTKH